MQAVEHLGKKSILIDIETYQRIEALREGNQTYSDVIAGAIRVLEHEKQMTDIPCIDDISEEEIDRREQEMLDHPEDCLSLEDIIRMRREKDGINHV